MNFFDLHANEKQKAELEEWKCKCGITSSQLTKVLKRKKIEYFSKLLDMTVSEPLEINDINVSVTFNISEITSIEKNGETWYTIKCVPTGFIKLFSRSFLPRICYFTISKQLKDTYIKDFKEVTFDCNLKGFYNSDYLLMNYVVATPLVFMEYSGTPNDDDLICNYIDLCLFVINLDLKTF